MQIFETAESTIEEINQLQFDCFICSSGFEERASYLARVADLKVQQKVVLCFNNFEEEGFRKINDSFYKKRGFQFIYADGDQAEHIIEILKSTIKPDKSEINIGIDYSSMTRVWYSAIVNFFDVLQHDNRVNLYFSYSFSKFSQPINTNVRNLHIGPIKNFSSLSIPDKPTALIIGLGYEKERAFGLTEYFDAETYFFIADKSKGEDYFDAVINANSALIDSAKPENIFEYSLQYLNNSESLLYAVCKSLKSDYRLVLAPTGPKPFTLLCLLISIRFKNIDVWRISAGKYSQPSNKEPEGTFSIYKVSFF